MELAKLKDPFPPDRVSWRVGSTNAEKTRGMALAYIDARDVQDRLDAVCGPHLWQTRYQLLGATTICEIGIKVAEEWIWKADGAGATDFEGEKGALSDAFKRAAVKWGIGRYLYDTDAPWVEIETKGKTSFIKPSELPKLRGVLEGRKITTPIPPKEPITETAGAAQKWAAEMLVNIKKTRSVDELDALDERNRAAMTKLRAVDERARAQLILAIRNQYAALESIPA